MLAGYSLSDADHPLAASLGLIDRWVTPFGGVAGEFHRTASGFLVVFPDQAEFAIETETLAVSARPLMAEAPLATLFRNAIVPLVCNYSGGLALHGSAVATPQGALAFMGLSRRGKTTLAGAFAKAGHPLLSEDCVMLEAAGGGYRVTPQGPHLRLFADSAAHLLGEEARALAGNAKAEMSAAGALPVASEAAPLRAIFLLGDGTSEEPVITPLSPAAALTGLMPHAFVLDVEDKARLRGHFERIGTLADTVPCHALDYPRRFDHLPRVIAAVGRAMGEADAAE